MWGVILTVLSYLLGSVLFGEIIARYKGVDIRSVGSGNVGATNVSRALGKKYGALVFFLDMLKGFIPTAIAVSSFGLNSIFVFTVGIASILGHMYPVFSNFKGGKGVATSFGVVLAISFKVALILLIIWGVVLYWKRYVSLASITASVIAPFIFLLGGFPFSVILLSVISAILIVYRHKENIERLRKGEELKV